MIIVLVLKKPKSNPPFNVESFYLDLVAALAELFFIISSG